ncbi:tyrosine-type recombinase/integrase [Cellulomonas phragmiteti]|uniref:Tyr recombinase domain-containing protein n=1 Tax=Cellulomonas phragmiteti TaxID=478780 RepID=A0ABQ4DRC0_9CELL|nr:tyrosine-type recombinase/integrase [Cellulomonas phragmiteti]GIG41903.1 hypothetical protein Cph01nite_36650 [Cellulomonas phragmiteti]
MGRPAKAAQVAGEVWVKKVDGGYVAGTWARDAGGRARRLQRTRTSKAAAMNAVREAAQTLQPRAGEAPADELHGETTIGRLLDVWLTERLPDLRDQSIVTYRHNIAVAARAGFTDLTLDAATTPVLDRLLKALAAQRPGNARTLRSILRMALSLAVRHGAVDRNAADHTAAIPRGTKPVRALDDDELRQMLGILRGVTEPVAAVQAACVLRVQLATALRVGEVLALTSADVMLDGPMPTVTVGATVVPASSRGLIRQPMAKSAAGHRVVPLTRDGVAALREAAALGLDRGPDRLWFPSMTSGRLRQPGAIRTELTRLVEGSDLAWVTTHTMRKTTATRVARAYDDATAAALLGHSGTATIRAYVQRSHQAPNIRDVLEVDDAE